MAVNEKFESIKISQAQKSGLVAVEVQFVGSDKVYRYIRKNRKGMTTVEGYRIHFDSNYNVTEIYKGYDVRGTAPKSSGSRTTADKIKEDLEDKDLDLTPDIPQEPPKPKYDFVSGVVHHSEYETIKACLECAIPVYLAGPAGSGKNHTVEQIAEELGWDFYFSNSVQQEYKLTGFIDAGGQYHETEFYKACTSEKECVFFLDEMDASIPEVLVLLNAAIANGYFEFPNGRVTLKHVHFVAAGNTVGSGADEMYTGRMVIDQATLDRFTIINFDYDIRIELSITKNNIDLVDFIHQLREYATTQGIRATFSYRCMTMVTKLEKAGMDLVKIMQIAVMKGLDKDTINTFYLTGESKYHKALRKVQQAA